MDDDDDFDEMFGGMYEDGHWEWNDSTGGLVFQSDLTPEKEVQDKQVIITAIEFKDDLDLLEQQKFRKKFQRKISSDDVVILQDIKDVVLFTAPKSLLTPTLVSVLHLPMTDRFMRALIAYCQYYLQISNEMSLRMLELQTKISTPKSKKNELIFRENLEDLRLLVAKEYCSIIMGAGEFAKYHHMGAKKKSRSLSKTEALLFESILRISMQIVWLALGRKFYNQLELEIHRLFKSEIYNIIEHKLKIKYRDKLDPSELVVMFGHCLKQGRLTNSHSPLMSEVQCNREIDYRLLGLGVVKFESLNSRLRFFERILVAPEETLMDIWTRESIGILGLPRSNFDTMLKEIKIPVGTTSSTSVRQSFSKGGVGIGSKNSRISTCSGKSGPPKLYEDIIIPDITDIPETFPKCFPSAAMRRKSINDEQRKKWLDYSKRIQYKKNNQNKQNMPSYRSQTGKNKK